jgi:hypothetical protein
MLAEAGCTLPEIVSITGHTLRRAQDILDKYLARTSKLAESAIHRWRCFNVTWEYLRPAYRRRGPRGAVVEVRGVPNIDRAPATEDTGEYLERFPFRLTIP